MCAICLAGLVGGWIVRVPGIVLLAVAVGLTAVLWMVWVDPPAGGRKTSALAHTTGGVIVGWACVETLRRRLHDPLAVAILALSLVIVLTVLWEVGEYVGDRLLDTALVPSKRNSAEDIFLERSGARLASRSPASHRYGGAEVRTNDAIGRAATVTQALTDAKGVGSAGRGGSGPNDRVWPAR